MSLPPLPEPYYTNGGAYDSWAPFDDLWSAEQMRAFYAEGVRAGMEQAAKLCENLNHGAFGAQSYLSGIQDGSIGCAAAIRAAAKQGGQG